MRSHRIKRLGVAVLCVVCGAVAFWSSLLLFSRWDDLWSAGDFYQSGSLWSAMGYYQATAYQYAELNLAQSWGEELDYLHRLQLQQLENSLSAENTNYRYRLRTDDGTLLSSNLAEGEEFSALSGQETASFSVTRGSDLYDQDLQRWNKTGYRLQVWTGEAYVEFFRENAADVANAQAYGYSLSEDPEDYWSYERDQDSRVHTASLVLESAVTDPLTVDDNIWSAWEDYNDIQRLLTPLTLVCLASLSATLAALAWLCRRENAPPRGWQERIPYDLYLTGDVLLFCVLLSAGDPITFSINRLGYTTRNIVGLGLLSLAGAVVVLAGILTTVTRLRGHTLWHSTLLWRMGHGIRRWLRETAQNWPITRRAVWLFLLYLLGTALTSATVILIPVYQGAVLWAICRWVRQWRAIRTATDAIVQGAQEVHIDEKGLYRDLREHARQLNDLGSSIQRAVEEQLKSERFKAELITNVSHDLKTPLTSILNYVDLLKKTEIADPKAAEYLDVLDRKARRLKKLTEDLVEASKASSGVLPVHLEPLDFAQLAQQAAGEYEDRFQQAGLTAVLNPPAGDCAVLADGRHLWRVLDNLFGNCCKYALAGTRVYLDLTAWEGEVRLTVKNISRAPLNLSPEQLMERFVRGDTARSSDGSGLGLSIAQSLTELQGGSFRVEIDGDLFKAIVSLPAAPPPPPPDVQEPTTAEEFPALPESQ
ncbi:hypothetical protein B5G43_10010 [Flavonifractor sp. An92]|uniref:sensor histidine kinase n=1 Tax=Flavonifractor sp. An92 TaxID=1965666 RepID=UPI000B37CECE|nr:HAMP domain-containing sensor histidine kinase [Flavonifractor sp. An92]OUN06282.1 hypothetical protein B5G43_10010 [Flavonifractor sp. An92]